RRLVCGLRLSTQAWLLICRVSQASVSGNPAAPAAIRAASYNWTVVRQAGSYGRCFCRRSSTKSTAAAMSAAIRIRGACGGAGSHPSAFVTRPASAATTIMHARARNRRPPLLPLVGTRLAPSNSALADRRYGNATALAQSTTSAVISNHSSVTQHCVHGGTLVEVRLGRSPLARQPLTKPVARRCDLALELGR
ncbi:MAG: hypothetical protein JWR52_2714, partial [Marmoricola sp.]|nr:hypothetical protein [Marmoricola sp.]